MLVSRELGTTQHLPKNRGKAKNLELKGEIPALLHLYYIIIYIHIYTPEL